MLHFMMTNQYFYYGIIAAGVLGLLSAVLTDLYYRTIVRDLKRVRKPRGKWMRSFITELDNRKMLQQDMQNADAFIRSRLASGKIFRITIGSLHSFTNLMTFVVAVLTGLAVYATFTGNMDLTTRLTYLAGGASVCAVLLLMPILCGTGRKSELILDSLADYVENCRPGQAPVTENAAEPVKEKEPMLDQIVAGIRQSAAAGTKFSGLLSKDEEHILREVIREYMV